MTYMASSRQLGFACAAYLVLGLFVTTLSWLLGSTWLFAPLVGPVDHLSHLSPLALFVPAGGVALVILLWSGPRALPLLWAVTVPLLAIVLLINGLGSLPTVLGLATFLGTLAILKAGLAAWLVPRVIGESWRTLEQPRDILLFLVVGGPLAGLVIPLIGGLILQASGYLATADLFFAGLGAWLTDALGVALLAPLAVMVAQPGEPIWRERLNVVVAATVAAFAIIASSLIYTSRWEHDQHHENVQQHGEDISQRLQQRFDALTESLSALRRLIEVSPQMNFQQFQYFTRITLQDSKEIAALSFNPIVRDGARAKFEASQSRIMERPFAITERDSSRKLVPAAHRDEYVPVAYIAPLDSNGAALGFDIFSEEIRRDAILRARHLGTPAATQAIRLVQDQRHSSGVLVLHPAYHQVFYMTDSPEQKDLIGFAVGVLKIDEMVQIATWNRLPPGLTFELRDRTQAARPADTLYRSDPQVRATPSVHDWSAPLTLADRRWEITFTPTDEFLRDHRSGVPLAVAGVSLAFVLLLQILLLAGTARAATIQRKVADQTALIRAQGDKLALLLAEHQELIQRVPVGVYKLRMLAGGGFQFDYVSPLWCEQLGVRADDVIDNPSAAFACVHPDDLDTFMRSQQEALGALTPFKWEGRFLRHGEERWLQLQSLPTRLDNGDVIWEGVQNDITDRKHAEEQSRLLSSAIEQSNASVIITDSAGDIVFVNEAFMVNTGYSREEVTGRNPRLMQSGQTPQKTYQELWGTITAGGTWRGELQNRMKSGELYWELATISPVVDPRGRITHFIGIKDNITERKRQEAEVRRAKEDAEAANLAKSQFLATMSHEIRTPMNGILGMAQLLLMGETSEEEQRNYLRIILNSGNTLQSLLNDILDLSKVEAGKLELHPAVFDPHQVVDETVALFSGPAQQKGLQISAAWHGAAQRRYRADPMRLRQMLSNLINNAIKFTTKGQIQIDAAEISRDEGGALLSFSVTDTGIGITADQIERLFKPFSQVDASSTRQYGGTGLGLSIVKRLAELMNGSVGVDSQPGNGSRFWFRIRAEVVADEVDARGSRRTGDRAAASPAALVAVPPAPTFEPATESGQLILVVEDNVTNRKVVEAILDKSGFSVRSVENGAEAVALIENGLRPALVLMDCQMPVMNGFEATRRIRAFEAQDISRGHLPILALTAGAFDEDRQNAFAAGMDDFLTKPIIVNALNDALSRWL